MVYYTAMRKPVYHVIQSVIVLLLIGGAFIVGLFTGYRRGSVFEKENQQAAEIHNVNLSSLWNVWDLLDEKYPFTPPEDKEKVEGIISGLVHSYNDPYTIFFPPQEAKEFAEEISGEFTGVGMEVGIENDVITVIAPLKNTPAYNAGIQSGDLLLKIDDTYTNDINLDEAIHLIRGEKGTSVVLTILREGENQPREITVVRNTISIPTLETKVIEGKTAEDKIFVLTLFNFSKTSDNLFREAMREFQASGAHKIIFDLRGNPGGYLEAAVDIASWFLPEGKPIVREAGREGEEEIVYRSKGYLVKGAPEMVILIDKGSASASEIVAGALKEHKVAILVGDTTFGKGSVQELIKLDGGSSIKITVAKWLTPEGVLIDKEGIAPDHKVSFTKEDLAAKKDPQMEYAVKLLQNKK